MGSSISGILAILFMDKLETIALSSHLIISPYKRYVDDIYLQTTNEETADHFHHIINKTLWERIFGRGWTNRMFEDCYEYEGYVGSAVVSYNWGVSLDVWS